MKKNQQYKINCIYDKKGPTAEEVILKAFDIYLKEQFNKTKNETRKDLKNENILHKNK